MNKRLRLLHRQLVFNLRGGFLVRPLTIALALGAGGAIFSWLEETFPWLSEIVPSALFPSHSDPQVSQFIVGGIAASIMTVVSIVFAILLMTLTLPSMQFSPRIIVSFARDRVTQWTLGIFLGTFLLHGRAPGSAHVTSPFRSRCHCRRGDVAGAGLRGLAAFLHSPHFRVHQCQQHRRQDCLRNRSHD